MLRRLEVSVFLALVAFLGACGSDGTGPDGEHATITISVSPESIRIAQRRSASITVSLSSTGGFSGVATITVAGLPTGVTASDGSIGGGAGDLVVELNASADATAGTCTVTVRAEGTGVSSATRDFTLTVEEATDLTLAAGWVHTCALAPSGAGYCWGGNAVGQLGDGGTTESSSPVAVLGGHGFVQVAAAADHTCALDESGLAFCWGINGTGQLGDGTTADATSPVAVTGGYHFVQLAAGGAATPEGGGHTCGLDATGAAFCWGLNASGQLGNGSTTDASAPVPVLGGHRFVEIVTGAAHTCGLDADGAAFCWGDNFSGQLGIANPGTATSPTVVVGGHTFVQLAAGGAMGAHTCGIDESGAAFCWGWGVFGQIGDGTTTSRVGSPATVLGGHRFVRIAAGRGHTCDINQSGAALCWGLNFHGGLGDGSTTNATSPVFVQGGHTFIQLALGLHHSCGLDDNGAVLCWGGNYQGQVGNGTTVDQPAPVPVIVNW